MTSIARQDLVWVGLDVHKVSISAAVIRPGRESTEATNLMPDDASVRKFFSHLGPAEALRACYEAGPTGYHLQRKLAGMGISCQVAAPSLIPRVPGDKVKTDLLTELPEVAGPVRAWPKGGATTLPAGAR